MRKALGLSAIEVSERSGMSLRSIKLYDSGKLEPSEEADKIVSNEMLDMSERLIPYLNIRSGRKKTYTFFDYKSTEQLHAATGQEFSNWSLSQYRAFLGHVLIALTAKGIDYQIIQLEEIKE